MNGGMRRRSLRRPGRNTSAGGALRRNSGAPRRAGRERAVLHHTTGRGEQGHGVGGGVGVDSNDTVVLLGDSSHGKSPLSQRDGEMSAQGFRRQTCNESRPWSDRLLIKPSGGAEPASPPVVDGHINCKASTDHTDTAGPQSQVTQESRPQPRRHQLCQPAPGQPGRALQVTHRFVALTVGGVSLPRRCQGAIYPVPGWEP